MSIEKKVKNTIKNNDLIKKGDSIVVGVSGGPDSVCLLYLLNSLKKDLKINLYIAHLDHMLRSDSANDRKFVEQLGKKINAPVICAQVNIKSLAKKGSIEEIARNVRLGFLFRVAKEVKAKKIALGHNLNDQAETVLMRIIRGTGLYGLSGILPKRKLAGFEIIRPLIEIKRSDIEKYLKKRRISARIDTSNLQNIYFRNKIRNELIPLLEKKYNKNIKEVLANLANSAGCDYDYLTQAALLRFSGKVGPKFNLGKILKVHPSIRRIVQRKAIANLKGDTRRITFQHIKEIEDLVLNRPINSIVDLPGKISVAKKKKQLVFYRR